VLAFDPGCSVDYKVLCFTAWRARGAELEMYSSQTGKWDRHGVLFGIEPDAMSTMMHYFDGILYILAYPNMIVALDLMKFSCNLIQLPEPINRLSCAGHCQGRLHYAHMDGSKLKIWMMSYLNRNKWGLKHEIELREIMGKRELNPSHPEEELVCVWCHNWRMVWYDFKERKLVVRWKFEREKVFVIQIWLFPCSSFLTNCLA
jgi:hypothetical protein